MEGLDSSDLDKSGSSDALLRQRRLVVEKGLILQVKNETSARVYAKQNHT